MNILALDDDELALTGLVSAVKQVEPDAMVYSFRKPKEALEFCKNTSCEVALLDVPMRNMNGVEFAKEVKLLNPRINIIFTTGYTDYMKEAFELHASGYVMKPITPAKIRKELDNLRYPVKPIRKNRVRFQTFGNFEMFIDNQIVKFKYNLTKEMLAYLVDRNGEICVKNDIMTVLWGDKCSPSYFRTLVKDLNDILRETGCEDIIYQQRGKIGIVRKKVDCDYYDWLDGKSHGVNLYQGEYMTQYSWGEITNASLTQNKNF
ncbi:MAG: response regulator [Lachnospiraceae bacterium]